MPYSAERNPLPDLWQPLWEGFERHLRIQGRSERTLNGYQESLWKLADHLAAGGRRAPDLLKVDRAQVESVILRLQAEDYAANTVLRHFRGLAVLFSWLVEEDLIAENPMARLRPPQVKLELPPVLSDEAITKLLKACEGRDFEARRDTALVRFLIDTGCRRGEVESMTVGDTDTKAGTAVVTGKGGGTRVVSMGNKTAQAVWRYLVARQRHRGRGLPWLWLGTRGRLFGNGMYQVVRRRAREAGLEERMFVHLFRHTSTHLALVNGANERDVITLNGWSSGAMLGRYGASAAQERAIAAHKRFSPGDRF
jgi:site-specific recombinase XerD